MNERLKVFRWLVVLGTALSLLAGCGGSDVAEPGLVGIDDRPVSITPPVLEIAYTLPGNPNTLIVATIVSDQPADGDIAYDPVLDVFTTTLAPDTLWFGFDSLDAHRPEYRAFLDFPLDGSTGDPVIPADGIIESAELTVFIEFVDFNSRVPVLVDLVQYPPGGLAAIDFDSIPFAVRSLSLFSSDAGSDVLIDVTGLMREAQFRGFPDLQLRLLVP